MERSQLEHILRAAAGITGNTEFVVIGSQAIHGQTSKPPRECLASIEADIFSLRSREDADLIDGSIGEASPFHRTFGYYAHGVAEETAVLPAGWKERLVSLRSSNTGVATGFCLEAHDLAVSKLVAGREKDVEFVQALIRDGLINAEVMGQRLDATRMDDAIRASCLRRLGAMGFHGQ
jgi:hypothetical protein